MRGQALDGKSKDMAKDTGPEDKYFEALDFASNVLKKHEQILDRSIQELATLTEYLEYITALYNQVENAEEKIAVMQKEVASLTGGVPKVPEETFKALLKGRESQVWTQAVIHPAVVQSGSSLILQCKRWGDFVVLAMNAQTLSFSYREDEQAFQVNAIKGGQIIRYTGALPNFSIILKAWLYRQLNVAESD